MKGLNLDIDWKSFAMGALAIIVLGVVVRMIT